MVLAAGFLFAVFALGQLIVRELRAAPSAPVAAPVARALMISVPAAVPSRAVSVPMLPFQDGKDVKVGDTMRVIAEAFGRAAEVGRQEVDRGALRRAADPLLRIRPDAVHPGVRALRDEGRAEGRGHLPALALEHGQRLLFVHDQLPQRTGERQVLVVVRPVAGITSRSVLPPA